MTKIICRAAFTASALALLPLAADAETTCYGSGAYRVCSTVTQHPDGSMSLVTRDSTGYSYRVDSEVATSRSGAVSIRTYDSEGYDYEVESWSDSRGIHTRDTEGYRCTITPSGTTIGCE